MLQRFLPMPTADWSIHFWSLFQKKPIILLPYWNCGHGHACDPQTLVAYPHTSIFFCQMPASESYSTLIRSEGHLDKFIAPIWKQCNGLEFPCHTLNNIMSSFVCPCPILAVPTAGYPTLTVHLIILFNEAKNIIG